MGARAVAAVRKNFTCIAYGLDVKGASSSENLCSQSNVIFTQTTGSDFVLNLSHLRKGMTIIDVYCELGELVNGTKAGRENDHELIVVDLTGTGAQDAAIGQVAWDKLSQLEKVENL